VNEKTIISEAIAFTFKDNPKRSMLQITSGKVVSVPVVMKATIKSSNERVKVSKKLAITAGRIIGNVT
jgi:hypothetical protein